MVNKEYDKTVAENSRWVWWIEENEPKEPSFNSITDKHGSTFHYKSEIGAQVSSPDRYSFIEIDPSFDIEAPSKSACVPVPKETPSKPKEISLWVKFLLIIGIMRIKKQNER